MSAEELNAQLLSQLECPVCLETCKTPIYMCTNGHSVCAKCQPQLNECSTCRAPGKPTLRCVQLEKIVALLKFPCENKPLGCPLTFNMKDLGKHLPLCNHGFNCLICREFKGTVPDLKEHVFKNHPRQFSQCLTDGTIPYNNILMLKKPSPDGVYLKMLHFNNDIFWLNGRFNSSTHICAIILRIVSNAAKDDSRYYYSLVIKPYNITSMHKVLYQADVLTDDAFHGRMDILLPACNVDMYTSGHLQINFKIKLKSEVKCA